MEPYNRLRSLVAESLTITETCFFFENNGNGKELGSGDIAKANPAYMSHFSAIRGESLRSTTQIHFGTISGIHPLTQKQKTKQKKRETRPALPNPLRHNQNPVNMVTLILIAGRIFSNLMSSGLV
jgi:hypothetical protein